MNLSTLDIGLILTAVVVIAVIAGLWLFMQKRKSAALRQKFGSEYNRAVLVHGSERKAEAKLEDREKRIEKLAIRDLNPSEHESFARRWVAVQARFVDSPKGAVMEADDLVSSVMKTRGYPVADFEQRAADISVNDPLPRSVRGTHAGSAAGGTEDGCLNCNRLASPPHPSICGADYSATRS